MRGKNAGSSPRGSPALGILTAMSIGIGRWIVLGVVIIAGAAAAVDPTERAVLDAMIQGLTNGALLGWGSGDPCSWKHIQCRGQSIIGIAVESLGLVGTLPGNLNKLANLEYLGLQFNGFHGALPSLSGLKNLRKVYLNSNNFATIPGDFFRGLDSLMVIYLDHNNLNGTAGWQLPDDVQFSTKLVNLSLTNTSLGGPIPEFLGTMASLKVLNLAYNSLTGGLPASFKDSAMTQLEVNNMALGGSIDVVGGMTSLAQLWLQGNQFTGTIPVGLSNAVAMADLRLNDNKLKGVVPNFTALALSHFSVTNNNLMGPIPLLRATNTDGFGGNKFCQSEAGKACSAEVTALLGFLGGIGFPDSIIADWSGTDPCAVTWVVCDGTAVIGLKLERNQLAGTLSPAVAGLADLRFVMLSNNNLSGSIPPEFATMKSLKTLDLRNNSLSGPMVKFSGVTVLVDGNPLLNSPPGSAPVPPSSSPAAPAAPAGSAPATTPSPPSPPGTPPPPGTQDDSGNRTNSPQASSKFPIVAVAVPIAGAVSLALVAGVFIFFLCCRHKGKHQASRSSSSGMLVHPRNSNSDPDMVKVSVTRTAEPNGGGNHSGPSGDVHVVEAGNLVISIQVLRDATKNFSRDTILGRGGFGVVYKGVLDDGTSIAVKRMEASTVVSSKGLSEFHAEIAVLTKVRHRHLVALLGYCIEGNEKLLVYEYLPNGTLAQHLFERGAKPLDWKRRLVIALDVARGMEYLHELAHMSFIHRDLKPSNILLDDDYRAKVSDFGLVKLAPEGKYSIETRLAGTFGYLAPEYAVTGRVTTKADVFSFGVVLMELITGRRALDESQSEENMHLVTWFRRTHQGRESFARMIDTALLEGTEDKVEGIYTVAELAKHCTAREPYNRPDMGHAVSVLAPLVEQWKPTASDGEETKGIDLNVTLPQALKQWQASDDSNLDDSQASLPTRPVGFADSFTSSDAR
ncbi:receptor-like kinase TMK3 [Selaginella moellendorffii]|uniref:receptor-like kinase TMK3 n=1 Tax=Selaginella moellendorffii TaxID=88036 RepID=UPI000D1C7B2E|nr:receptor-like kinase TMK3 [Selaginella moellendorffii]XP_024516693.1 receptor-like kinase TMK3 [Selaginella moellendorffii]XP_024516694.1 receptor-like kinase TMK3 [Selaginella moellendorffii]|eukprot:XP_024516692.1 receptor-like kinase TMK3 [Selaginella moellendorffii]